MMPTLSLVPVWTAILALAVFFYVALDGFDLGVGMLYNFAPDRRARDLVMSSIAPIWDGNETWLVLGSLGLLAAFPLAFAIIIPAVYFPILLMLLALIFRGLAFEFRYRDAEHRTFWDHGFAYGSALAAFAQGVVLGAFIQGFHVEGRHFAGSSFDCFTLFSAFTGIALMFGYGLLGAGWLVIKTEGALQDWARAFGCPVHLHAADRQWLMRSDASINFWQDEQREIADGVTLLRLGGHFEGGTVLHWAAGSEGRGAILSGDILQVAADTSRVSFLWSYPNMMPLAAATVRRIAEALKPWPFDRVYGAFPGRQITADGKRCVERSAARYIELLNATQP